MSVNVLQFWLILLSDLFACSLELVQCFYSCLLQWQHAVDLAAKRIFSFQLEAAPVLLWVPGLHHNQEATQQCREDLSAHSACTFIKSQHSLWYSDSPADGNPFKDVGWTSCRGTTGSSCVPKGQSKGWAWCDGADGSEGELHILQQLPAITAHWGASAAAFRLLQDGFSILGPRPWLKA